MFKLNELENLTNDELLQIYQIALEHQEMLLTEKEKVGDEEEK